MTATQQQKYKQFQQLHAQEDAFIIPNPWDAGSARLLANLGFAALATTSAGYAFSVGKRDSFAGLSRAEILANARSIVEATDLPVSADLEDGFSASPAGCFETIQLAIDSGLVGGSIEDATGDKNAPIYDIELAVERMQAASEACRNQPFLLTGRAENYLWGKPDLKDTIERLQRYSQAGAEVLYAPGLPDISAIKTVCAEVDKPVNVVMGLAGTSYSVAELAEVGVKRISVGGSLARAALAAMLRAAEEMLNYGTFSYAEHAIPDAVISELMSPVQLDNRLG